MLIQNQLWKKQIEAFLNNATVFNVNCVEAFLNQLRYNSFGTDFATIKICFWSQFSISSVGLLTNDWGIICICRK
jgi:hypothetical protein